MALYSLAAKTLFEVDDVSLQYQFITKSALPSVTLQTIARTDPAKEERGALTLASSSSLIISIALSHAFPQLVMPKHRSWRCSGCGYRSLCAAQD